MTEKFPVSIFGQQQYIQSLLSIFFPIITSQTAKKMTHSLLGNFHNRREANQIVDNVLKIERPWNNNKQLRNVNRSRSRVLIEFSSWKLSNHLINWSFDNGVAVFCADVHRNLIRSLRIQQLDGRGRGDEKTTLNCGKFLPSKLAKLLLD